MSLKIERMALLVLKFEYYETLGLFVDFISFGSPIIGLKSLHKVEIVLSFTIFFKIRKQ